MKMDVKINNTVKFDDFNYMPVLKDVANKVVMPLLVEGILTNTNINGKPFPELEQSTKDRKQHERPLQDKLELIKSFYAEVKTSEIIIKIREIRRDIAKYLQIDGVGKKNKHFKFFGVTEGMEKGAVDTMQKAIGRYINNANQR